MAFRDRHLSNEDVEQLLAGAPLDSPDLDELLAAASAPAQPGELTGLNDAIAAFRSAPDELAAGSGHRSRFALKTLASGVLATKIVAGAVGAAAVGGVALAAGHIGQQATAHRLTASHAPRTIGTSQHRAAPRSTATHTSAVSSSSPIPTASATPRVTTHSPKPKATTSAPRGPLTKTHTSAPSPALFVLCRAWKAHEKHPGYLGRWADHSAFNVLVSAAGSASKIDPYCTSLLLKAPGPGKVISRAPHRHTPKPTPGRWENKPIVLPTSGPHGAQPGTGGAE